MWRSPLIRCRGAWGHLLKVFDELAQIDMEVIRAEVIFTIVPEGLENPALR
jgi:hypothetical protein